MSMREVPHGGLIKPPVIKSDYTLTMSYAEVNMNINGSDTVLEHGGIISQPDNYQGIETVMTPNNGVNIKFFPPIPPSLIVDHGGAIKSRGIVNDEQ